MTLFSFCPKYWDFSKNRSKVNCPNKEQIEKFIIDKSKAYNNQIIELKAENKDFTPTSLIEKVDKPTKRLTAGELFLQQIDQLKKEERFPYAASYKQTYNSLIEYNRYKAGNYYRNKDEAFEFIRNCIHLRKIQLCTP